MEHLRQDAFEPVSELIGNLAALPRRCRQKLCNATFGKKQILSEKEQALISMERALAERSSALAEAEFDFKERWDAGRIHALSTGSILPNPAQPRRTFDDLALFSLADSIRRHGILQPLTVRRLSAKDGLPQTYELICGERRLRAACAVGLDTVPCIILDADRQKSAELALIENLQRENLNMFEQAGAIAALMDMHTMTQEQIAETLSVTQSCIANRLRILKLTEEERTLILDHHLSERHARTFLRLKDLELRKETVAYTASHALTVAQTETYIDRLLEQECSEKDAGDPRSPTSGRHPKIILKDIRLLLNTVDHAVAAVRDAGIPVASEKEESDTEIKITIILPRNHAKT